VRLRLGARPGLKLGRQASQLRRHEWIAGILGRTSAMLGLALKVLLGGHGRPRAFLVACCPARFSTPSGQWGSEP
jgi:hypothetical protein